MVKCTLIVLPKCTSESINFYFEISCFVMSHHHFYRYERNICFISTYPWGQVAGTSPSCHHICYIHWSTGVRRHQREPTSVKWLEPPCSKQTSSCLSLISSQHRDRRQIQLWQIQATGVNSRIKAGCIPLYYKKKKEEKLIIEQFILHKCDITWNIWLI